jgi:hypothetical protein
MFATPFIVVGADRIAVTPTIDGKLDEEEWDPLGATADGSKTFFEWEPEKLHAAAVVPNGHDALFSFDLDSNGWLVGKDNLEVRLSLKAGKPEVTARVLDASNPNGPEWRNIPGLEVSAKVAASSDATNTTYEVSITDPGLGIIPTDNGDTIGIRVDDPLSTDQPYEPFYPRKVTPINLVYIRSAGLPSTVKFNVEGSGRTYVAGERGHLRFTFNGSDDAKLQRLELRSEGGAKLVTNTLAVPFPKFDKKGRAYVDYDTGISDQASYGWRVARGTLTGADGVPAIVQASYKIAPPVEFSLVRQPLPAAANDRSIKFILYAHSNSGRPLKGEVKVSAPLPLKVVNGDTKEFEMATGRAKLRMGFELFVPANTVGTFPIQFTGDAKGVTLNDTIYITIGG